VPHGSHDVSHDIRDHLARLRLCGGLPCTLFLFRFLCFFPAFAGARSLDYFALETTPKASRLQIAFRG
jgi:hypothetical protein